MKRLVALLLLTFLMTGSRACAQDSPLLTAPDAAAGWNQSDSTAKAEDSKDGTTVSQDDSKEPGKEIAQADNEDSKKDSDKAPADADKKTKTKVKKSKKKTDKDSDSKDAAASVDSKDKASTSSDTTEKTDQKPDDASKAKTGGFGQKKAKSTVPLPTRMASFTCGAVLGYPFAMAKRTVHQTKAGVRDFVGEGKNPIKVGTALIISIPYGVVGGFLEGAQYTVLNSWKASGDEPFGKETFSIGDDDTKPDTSGNSN